MDNHTELYGIAFATPTIRVAETDIESAKSILKIQIFISDFIEAFGISKTTP